MVTQGGEGGGVGDLTCLTGDFSAQAPCAALRSPAQPFAVPRGPPRSRIGPAAGPRTNAKIGVKRPAH